MPWSTDGGITDIVVPPALAVLFRMAVGPGADFYVPRFLHREGYPRALPGWVWPAFFLSAAWAFYRKLWGPGILFALLHFLGLGAFLALGERLASNDLLWWSALGVAVLIAPGALAAMLAIPLLHRDVRRRVRSAEARSQRPDQVASLLAERQPTSTVHALLLGFGALALFLALAGPLIERRHEERVVRARVATSLAAVGPLRLAVEASREQSVYLPALLQQSTLAPGALQAAWLEAVAIDPRNGRLRLDFAPATAALAGKSLLLAPAIDAQQRLHWLCVPIDIPPRYLPLECRSR